MESPRKRRPLLLRIFRGLIGGIATLTILFLLTDAVLLFWGQRDWANAQAELSAKREKLSLVELMPPAVADEDNFFAIPIWQEVLELEQASERNGTPILKEKKKRQDCRIDAFKNALHTSGNGSPMSVMRGGYEKGTRRDFDAAAALYRDQKKVPRGLSSPLTILAALDEAKPELEEIQGAVSRPQANLGLPRDGNFFRLPLPYLSPALSIAQYLGIRIAAEAAAGRGVEAKSNLFLLLRLADALQSDPVLISVLVRLSILSIATQAVWDGLDAGCWNESQLGEIQTRLSSIDLSRDFANGLRAERGGANQTLGAYAQKGGMAQYAKDATLIADMATNEKRSDWEKQLAILGTRLYPRGLLFESLTIYNRLIQEIIEKAEADPFAPNFGEPIQQRISELKKFPNPFLYPLIVAATSVLTLPQTRVANMETRLRLARIAIALERYRRTNGSYPESLEALVTTFFEKLPTDVIDGKNFRYRREAGDQFVLWSIGANHVDDAGKPPDRLNKLEEGDWVWRTATDPKPN